MTDTTLINAQTQVSGEVRGDADVRLEGRVQGRITLDAALIVGQSGVVRGDVHVREAHVSGEVEGTITASERITLTATARVAARLEAPLIAVADGAQLRGEVVMDVEAPAPQLAPSAVGGVGAGSSTVRARTSSFGSSSTPARSSSLTSSSTSSSSRSAKAPTPAPAPTPEPTPEPVVETPPAPPAPQVEPEPTPEPVPEPVVEAPTAVEEAPVEAPPVAQEEAPVVEEEVEEVVVVAQARPAPRAIAAPVASAPTPKPSGGATQAASASTARTTTAVLEVEPEPTPEPTPEPPAAPDAPEDEDDTSEPEDDVVADPEQAAARAAAWDSPEAIALLEELDEYTVKQLRHRLRRLEQPTSGTKTELIDRIIEIELS